MTLTMKNFQAGWKKVQDENGNVVAELIKNDGIIVIDHIATGANDV